MGKKTIIPIYSAPIGESGTVVNNLYLLVGTFLYTDGTPTSSVSGAIQTIETGKYKIKANALVNITGATQVTISN